MATLQQDLFNAAIKNMMTGRGFNAGNVIRQVGASQAGGYLGNIAGNAASNALKDAVPKSIGNSLGGFTGNIAGGAIQSLLMGGKVDIESLMKQAALKQGTKFIGNELVKAATPSMGVQTIKGMKDLGSAGGGVGNFLGSIASGIITKGAETKGGSTGGNIGGMIGSAFGPVGSILGSIFGTVVGDAFDDPVAMMKGTFKSNVDIPEGDGRRAGKIGKSAFGTFGLDDNYWVGTQHHKNIDNFITAIEKIDDVFAKNINFTSEEMEKVKNSLRNSEYRYPLGMETQGFQAPTSYLVDRYADVASALDPRLGDIVRMSHIPEGKIGDWIQKNIALMSAYKKNQLTDQQINSLRSQGIKQAVSSSYVLNEYSHKGGMGKADNPHTETTRSVGFIKGNDDGDVYKMIGGVKMMGGQWLKRFEDEWLASEEGQNKKKELEQQLAQKGTYDIVYHGSGYANQEPARGKGR